MVTPEQMQAVYRLCVNFTKFYIPIFLVTLDKRTGRIFLLAGENIEIEILSSGVPIYL
jgi:hypothetical protein